MIDGKLKKGDRVRIPVGMIEAGLIGRVVDDVTDDLNPDRQRVRVRWPDSKHLSTETMPFAGLERVQ